ncbi:hypothetical protein ABK730_01620 [Klebsiella indica]|uniref:Uncharacterized protein n=1 Tax=Klebsiella indica TaxID=2582917 RepID=A0A5R9LII7_9ENTR|nr:hypothetical protein [Klebsiella indica]TLV18288.1 hypothetical protein FE839_10360 [Klebsiella indica]
MKYFIEPGRTRKSINFIDNIIYSHSHDLNGNPLELKLSIMSQNGNSEMKAASGSEYQEEKNQLVRLSSGFPEVDFAASIKI